MGWCMIFRDMRTNYLSGNSTTFLTTSQESNSFLTTTVHSGNTSITSSNIGQTVTGLVEGSEVVEGRENLALTIL